MAVISGSGVTVDAAFKAAVKNLENVIYASASADRGQPFYTGQNSAWVKKIPWVMSTVELLKSSSGLIWFANPSEAQWSMAQRSIMTKTMTGTILHTWPNNNRHTFFDEVDITFTLQSGNIMPLPKGVMDNNMIMSDIGGTTTLTPETSRGLLNFASFIQLYDSPKITSDGRPNYVIIHYRSNIFPQLIMKGWFHSDGIKFTDSSDDPNTIKSWSVGFTMVDSIPRLSNYEMHSLVNKNLVERTAEETPIFSKASAVYEEETTVGATEDSTSLTRKPNPANIQAITPNYASSSTVSIITPLEIPPAKRGQNQSDWKSRR